MLITGQLIKIKFTSSIEVSWHPDTTLFLLVFASTPSLLSLLKSLWLSFKNKNGMRCYNDYVSIVNVYIKFTIDKNVSSYMYAQGPLLSFRRLCIKNKLLTKNYLITREPYVWRNCSNSVNQKLPKADPGSARRACAPPPPPPVLKEKYGFVFINFDCITRIYFDFSQ